MRMAFNIYNDKSPNKCLVIDNRIICTNYKIPIKYFDIKEIKNHKFFIIKINNVVQNADPNNIKPDSEIGVGCFLYDDDVPYYVYCINGKTIISKGTIRDGILTLENQKEAQLLYSDKLIIEDYLSEISDVNYWSDKSSTTF